MVESKKKDEDEDEIPTLEFDAGWDDWGDDRKGSGEPEGNERPTVVPKFDVEAFAKENATSKSAGALKRMQAPAPPVVASAAPEAPTVGAVRPSPPRVPSPPAIASRLAAAAAPSSEPFSQRSTPPHGIPTPVRVAQVTPEAAADADPSDRSGRPTTLRVNQETLLALANKVAGSYTPAPAYGEPLPEPPAATPADAPGAGPELELVEEPPDDGTADDPSAEMRDRFALGDYSGALVIAESLLEENPTLGEALEYADSCRAMLTKMYTSRIGPLDRVPVVDVQRDQLRWLSIDHRSGFVLSLVDGVSSLEMILDVSGMRELDALRILFELVQQRIISFR